MEKRFFLSFGGVVAYLLFFIMVTPLVSANFVCGKVNSVGSVVVNGSQEIISPSWFNVIVYYSEDPSESTSCKVSPADNKYCCDPQDIKGVSWQIGKEVSAEIFDSEKGYVSNKVSLIISGEGYDVFPEMFLEKAVQIHSPASGILLNKTKIFFNISIASRFNKIEYLLDNLTIIHPVCSGWTEEI